MLKFIVTCHYGNCSFEEFVGVSSPRTEVRGVVPQPEVPTKNIFYEIPSGMLEKLLANPFRRDGSSHPDLHLIYVDEVCGLFKLFARG